MTFSECNCIQNSDSYMSFGLLITSNLCNPNSYKGNCTSVRKHIAELLLSSKKHTVSKSLTSLVLLIMSG